MLKIFETLIYISILNSSDIESIIMSQDMIDCLKESIQNHELDELCGFFNIIEINPKRIPIIYQDRVINIYSTSPQIFFNEIPVTISSENNTLVVKLKNGGGLDIVEVSKELHGNIELHYDDEKISIKKEDLERIWFGGLKK